MLFRLFKPTKSLVALAIRLFFRFSFRPALYIRLIPAESKQIVVVFESGWLDPSLAESLDLSKGANFEGHYPQPFLTPALSPRRIFDRVKGREIRRPTIFGTPDGTHFKPNNSENAAERQAVLPTEGETSGQSGQQEPSLAQALGQMTRVLQVLDQNSYTSAARLDRLSSFSRGTKSIYEFLQLIKTTTDKQAIVDSPLDDIDLVIYTVNRLGHTGKKCCKLHPPYVPIVNFTSSNRPVAQDWLMDLAATHHVTNDMQNLSLHSEYHCLDKIVVGDESVSSIKENLISISKFCKTDKTPSALSVAFTSLKTSMNE
uniref:Uncharacterized protein n=1 Tax=Ananas comosus var. bracteatus TaxID=296719 RepID=A0A6V7PXV5_ANACO|nr:unnamed protein product [Ananas comosus var. bracteatus]